MVIVFKDTTVQVVQRLNLVIMVYLGELEVFAQLENIVLQHLHLQECVQLERTHQAQETLTLTIVSPALLDNFVVLPAYQLLMVIA